MKNNYLNYFNQRLSRTGNSQYIGLSHKQIENNAGKSVWQDADAFAKKKLRQENLSEGSLSSADLQLLRANSAEEADRATINNQNISGINSLLGNENQEKNTGGGLGSFLGDGTSGGIQAYDPFEDLQKEDSRRQYHSSNRQTSQKPQAEEASQATPDDSPNLNEETSHDDTGTTLENEALANKGVGEEKENTGSDNDTPNSEGNTDSEKQDKPQETVKKVAKTGKDLEDAVKKVEKTAETVEAAAETFAILAEGWPVLLAIIAVIFLFIVILFTFQAIATYKQDNGGSATKGSGTICIDPGHPSSTTGAEGEKELNMKVAIDLRYQLENRGFKVVMTKSTADENVGNYERAEICSKGGAIFMYSLHADATPRSAGYPFNVYPKDTRTNISAQSKKYAETIQASVMKSISGISGFKDGGVCMEGACTNVQDLGIYDGANDRSLPAALIEMVQLESGSSILDSQETRQKFVSGIADGIAEIFPADATSSNGDAGVVSGTYQQLQTKFLAAYKAGDFLVDSTNPVNDVKNGVVKEQAIRSFLTLVEYARTQKLKVRISVFKTGHSCPGSLHCEGLAFDIANEDIADILMPYLYKNASSLKLDELIFDNSLIGKPSNFYNLDKGKKHDYDSGTLSGHRNHIHVGVFQ